MNEVVETASEATSFGEAAFAIIVFGAAAYFAWKHIQKRKALKGQMPKAGTGSGAGGGSGGGGDSQSRHN